MTDPLDVLLAVDLAFREALRGLQGHDVHPVDSALESAIASLGVPEREVYVDSDRRWRWRFGERGNWSSAGMGSHATRGEAEEEMAVALKAHLVRNEQ